MLKKKQKAKVRYIWNMCHIVKWKETWLYCLKFKIYHVLDISDVGMSSVREHITVYVQY